MPAGFDKSCFGLRPVHAMRRGSDLLVPCRAAAVRLRRSRRDHPEYVGPHKLDEAKVAAQIDLIENGNWKLTMENNRECYHCTGHPELAGSIFPVYGYSAEDLRDRLRPAAERLAQATTESYATYERLGLRYHAQEELDTRPTGE